MNYIYVYMLSSLFDSNYRSDKYILTFTYSAFEILLFFLVIFWRFLSISSDENSVSRSDY